MRGAETMTDGDYTDDLALFANTPSLAESMVHSLKQAEGGNGLYVNTNKTKFMCFKQEVAIFMLRGRPLKLVDKFINLNSNISSTESDVKIGQALVWKTINSLSII